MQIGIDSFATAFTNDATRVGESASLALRNLVERIVLADQVGQGFGLGVTHFSSQPRSFY